MAASLWVSHIPLFRAFFFSDPPKLSPALLYNNAVTVAEAKAAMPWAKTFLLGILAGCYIAFGGTLSIAIGGAVPSADPGIQKLLFGLFFPVGLFMVLVSGGELVTVRPPSASLFPSSLRL